VLPFWASHPCAPWAFPSTSSACSSLSWLSRLIVGAGLWARHFIRGVAVRDDQYASFKALNEKLIDVVIVEANPEHWTGDPSKLAELTREERGDRYWCKKNAAATLSVLMRVSPRHRHDGTHARGHEPAAGRRWRDRPR
jgi:hypothetical protein